MYIDIDQLKIVWKMPVVFISHFQTGLGSV